jgi:hypothetical protein
MGDTGDCRVIHPGRLRCYSYSRSHPYCLTITHSCHINATHPHFTHLDAFTNPATCSFTNPACDGNTLVSI